MNYIYEKKKCYKIITCPKCGYKNKYETDFKDNKMPWYVCESCI